MMLDRLAVPSGKKIYFIQMGAGDGPVKIGITALPVHLRLKTLQTACPYSLSIIGIIHDATTQMESAIHKRFRHLRTSGEWHLPAEDLVSFIKEVTG